MDLEGVVFGLLKCVGWGQGTVIDFKLVLNVVCFLIRFRFTRLPFVPGESSLPCLLPEVGWVQPAHWGPWVRAGLRGGVQTTRSLTL